MITAKIEDELKKIHASARERNIPIIQDAELDLFIKTLKDVKPKNILEIGTAIGYSALIMATYSQGKITTIEKDEEKYLEAIDNIKNLGFQNQITVLKGDARDILCQIDIEEKFDLIFMDGPKSHYLEYIKIIEKNLAKNAVIISDDILFFGYVFGEGQTPKKHRTIVKNLREYIAYMNDNTKFTTHIYNIGHGIMISVYQVS